MKSGYADAILLATQKLESLNPLDVCRITGSQYEEGAYKIPWFGKPSGTDEGSDFERIIKLHYLISEGTKPPVSKWISYREVPGALFYDPKFIARAVNPIAKAFGDCPQRLVEAAKKLNADEAQAGDFAVTLYPLPYVPLTYIIWGKDDENEARASVLFDKTAPAWLCAEDLVVLASIATYALIAISK